MALLRTFIYIALFITSTGLARAQAPFADDQIAGLYQGYLLHEGTSFYQPARITLRTMNVNGQIKISANLRVLFGDWESNEYMIYDFIDVPLNIINRQISMKDQASDISMTGFLKDALIEGEWFSSYVGRVGKFQVVKGKIPEPPKDGVLVKTLSGFYRGKLENTHPQSNLPERFTMSYVTTQEGAQDGPKLKVSGNARFYLGDFDSYEYVETPFTAIQFNFYTRYLTAKTQEYGLTIKGYLAQDGKFIGTIHSDGLGEVGKLDVKRYP